MHSDSDALYTAYAARDARFDGVFFIGVTSTGIYCRPVCTARTPRRSNCRFFASAEAAEQANFRPCLRCRPELAPGTAPVDDAHRVAQLVADRIGEGMLDAGGGLERVAARFGWSSRQIRRLVRSELGVSPMQLVMTRRLLLAKQLLSETTLPMSQVAFASGFASLRRFNDAFGLRYGMPPSRLRQAAAGTASGSTRSGALTLQLVYRPPFDWSSLLAFLGVRAVSGVEHVTADAYARTARLGALAGWIRVTHHPRQRSLVVALAPDLVPALPALLARVRHLFDLSARPDVIAAHLAREPLMRRAVAAAPGLRVPGAFDGFEMAVRAILGQQVTVKSATTLARRFAERFGDAIVTPDDSLVRLSPTPERVAAATVDDIASLGIIRSRTDAIRALAREVATGRLLLEPGADPARTIAQLVALPGIGNWTAHYIALRALRWPDAFPREDIVVRRRLGGVSAARAEERSLPWRPWRAYATMHLWHDGGPGGAAPRPRVPDR